MKIPSTPPPLAETLRSLTAGRLGEILNAKQGLVDYKGRYLHWDDLKRKQPPAGLSTQEWWVTTKLARQGNCTNLLLKDEWGANLWHATPPKIVADLHWVDKHAAGSMIGDPSITSPAERSKYLLSSLFEEAITSSQLEGASTTRRVAMEMLETDRKPKDRHERMIFNNHQCMRFIRQNTQDELTPEFICDLHAMLTEKTLESRETEGRFRSPSKDEQIRVVHSDGTVLHTPPNSDKVPTLVKGLCDFVNDDSTFVHPVVKAIAIHFYIGYVHPFVDGNGRTARALFYWQAVRSGYWLIEFVSISKLLKQAPAAYGYSFLLTETDDNDLTYFLLHHLNVLKRSIEELHAFLERKTKAVNNLREVLDNSQFSNLLNYRQLNILKHAIRNPGASYTVASHKNRNGLAYDTARRDLLELADNYALLRKYKEGRTYVFVAPNTLAETLKAL